ncbi:Protein of unknown function [Pyronema omphalodes CBS 100304]|uniref:Uncharacterized protein n=1 Tax=Pyronema omphalodes (strain CBS 100304) TaxID=1076935 RepID=U4L342_PYROM|nr:Protein of unknown function [Pyronema omphalodes CBS 100304]
MTFLVLTSVGCSTARIRNILRCLLSPPADLRQEIRARQPPEAQFGELLRPGIFETTPGGD